MQRLLIISSALFLVACGGGGGGGSTGANSGTAPPDAVTPPPENNTSSAPLKDNTGAGVYKVLLMGNSHAASLQSVIEDLLSRGQPDKAIEVRVAPGAAFLDERRNDGMSEEMLASEPWTHVILQGQKYSTTGSSTYPTTAAETWIRRSKELGATPIMFPEHPREGNTLEGRTLWELHTGIAARENACVAPVGLVWDEVIFRDPSLDLYAPDGNHASRTGLLLTALVFYQVITGQPVDSLPALAELPEFDLDPAAEQIMRESASSLLFAFPPCAYES
jgi:hypothetical protein